MDGPWRYYDPRTAQEPVESWLENNPPSQISRDDGVGWIHVTSPFMQSTTEEENVIGLEDSWEALRLSGRPITLQTITELAKTYCITSGKWLFHVNTGMQVDHLWGLVVRGIVAGHVPADEAKVSSVNPQEVDYKHVICIYNSNFTDQEEVYNLEHAIRGTGIECPLSYKPDVYTYLGIYRQNEWGLRPTIYASNYDIALGISKIVAHE